MVVFDFNPDGKSAATTRPGVCHDLTAFIRSLQGQVITVAFVHHRSGHTVMPVLACKEIVMSKDCALGEIAGEGIEPERGMYSGYFEKDPRGFQLIRKMYDRDVELRKAFVRANPAQKTYIDARDPKMVADTVGHEPVQGVQDNQLALYTAQVARLFGLSIGMAETRAEVAERYGLPPSVIRDAPLQGRTPDVYRWVLKDNVDGKMRESVNRVIRDVRKKGGNVLILVINCDGHDLVTARGLADDLIKAQSGDDALQIIGFIPESAPAAATVIALGCTEIVMHKSKADAAEPKEAVLGDFEGYLKASKPAEIDANLASIRDLAKSQGYPDVLIDGMFKRDLEIVQVSPATDNRANQRRYMTREEFEKNKNDWRLVKTAKPPGQLLKLPATQAIEYGFARFTVEGTEVKDVSAIYGYGAVKDPDPGWLDRFADFLKLPVVTVLLVVIGFTGLILELKVPGLTVPGIIAALCFILVFWAHSNFSGQTFVLALLLFLMGLVLIGLEISCYRVSRGGFSVSRMLAGLGLVTLEKIPETGSEWGRLGERVSMYLFAMMGAFALAFAIAKFLPKVPYANRMILRAPNERPEVAGEVLPGAGEAAELLGAIGTTNTTLRPAGVVKFGDKFVDVVSDGGYIPAGTRVQVIQVEGTRIVVKEV